MEKSRSEKVTDYILSLGLNNSHVSVALGLIKGDTDSEIAKNNNMPKSKVAISVVEISKKLNTKSRAEMIVKIKGEC